MKHRLMCKEIAMSGRQALPRFRYLHIAAQALHGVETTNQSLNRWGQGLPVWERRAQALFLYRNASHNLQRFRHALGLRTLDKLYPSFAVINRELLERTQLLTLKVWP